MADLNMVALVGRLVRDCELKYSKSNGAIVRFSVAVNRRRMDENSKWVDEANYFDCVYFGKAAESVSQYLLKGRQVAIGGELRQNRWESEGQTRSKVEIFVNSLTLVGSQNQTGGAVQGSYQNHNSEMAQSRYASQIQSPVPSEPVSGPEDFEEDEIPF
ncbi:MAG TPA: single-stranded DNA-binding protein [Candidatus Ornithospirochaeta avicola]|uniref:Single-stranded DNA-binding protein n=1 Tax=Candidatus Ornithospirochaeta avicola TaxID=2840896 RepID=A0A9D1TMA5_9SPIO|nr:single-stranded DNA-binding protein [Candidatus Ornithospirochaeta avicola]